MGEFTGQVGINSSGKYFGSFVSGTFGLAVDGYGHVARYAEVGGGAATSPDFSASMVLHGSNGNSIQDLNGLFTNVNAGGAAMRTMKFLRWASTSALSHVVLLGGGFFIAETILFLVLYYRDGTLTISFALEIAIASFILGCVGALLFWYAVTLPRIRRLKSESR